IARTESTLVRASRPGVRLAPRRVALSARPCFTRRSDRMGARQRNCDRHNSSPRVGGDLHGSAELPGALAHSGNADAELSLALQSVQLFQGNAFARVSHFQSHFALILS